MMQIPVELLEAIVYLALGVAAITPLILIGLFIRDWRNRRLW